MQRFRRHWPMFHLALLLLLTGCATSTTSHVADEAAKASAAVAEATSPAKPEWFFHDIVDAAFVKQHLTVPASSEVMIIDSRPYKPKYIEGHIPMAVSIPDTQFEKMTDKLPADKNALLIFYCGGLDCKLSHKSAKKAEALGYVHVKVFAEGYPNWLESEGSYPSVSAEWVKKQLDDKADMVLIDSRPTRPKYNEGHLPTAISLPDSQFDKMTNLLPENKDRQLVFYCGGLDCKLSHNSARKAMALGYTRVAVFSGGYPEWLALADASGDAASQVSAPEIKSGKQEGSIDVEYFLTLVSERPESVHLIDVRDKDEFVKGSLKTSINIPVDELEKKIPTLPTDKPIIFVCGTGARSGESYYMVKDLRPSLKDVFYVDAPLGFTKDGGVTVKKTGK